MKDELLEVFDSRHLHQSIAEVSRDRFSNGDFWATILSAGAIVEKTVKEVLGSEGHLQNVMGTLLTGIHQESGWRMTRKCMWGWR